MRGSQERAVGQHAPNFRAVWMVPRKNVSPNREVATFYIFVSFFICEPATAKAKGWKISGLKPLRKLDLGYPRLLSLINDTGKSKCQLSPPGLKIVPAPLFVYILVSNNFLHIPTCSSTTILYFNTRITFTHRYSPFTHQGNISRRCFDIAEFRSPGYIQDYFISR